MKRERRILRKRREVVQPEVKLSQKDRLHLMSVIKQKTNLSIPIDGIISACTSEIHIDLFRLEKMIPNYDGDRCTYKGMPAYSMQMAIVMEYGEDVCEMIFKLI